MGERGADDALTTGTRSPASASQRQSTPSSFAGIAKLGCIPGSAPLTPTHQPWPRGLSHARRCPRAGPLLPRLGPPPPPDPSVLCCPASPLLQGARCSYLRPSGSRLSGSDRAPASSSAGRPPRGERMLRPLPEPAAPPRLSPAAPGHRARAPDRASRRVCDGRRRESRRSSPGQPRRRLRAPWPSPAAERSGASGPAPGGNKRGWRWGERRRAGPGAAGAGTRRAALRFSGPVAEPSVRGRAENAASLLVSSQQWLEVSWGAPTPTSAPACYWCFSRFWRKNTLQPCSTHKDGPDLWERWKPGKLWGGTGRFQEVFTEEVTWTGQEER